MTCTFRSIFLIKLISDKVFSKTEIPDGHLVVNPLNVYFMNNVCYEKN